MVEVSRRAVLKCAPLKLPAELYAGGWRISRWRSYRGRCDEADDEGASLLALLLLGVIAARRRRPSPPPPPRRRCASTSPRHLAADADRGAGDADAHALETPAGGTGALGRQVADVITGDLRNSGLFTPLDGGRLLPVAFAQVTAPDYAGWLPTGAQALVQGFVQANGDGTLTVGCYLYDTFSKTELAREGFVVQPAQWRRAAHKCADTVYARLTGEGPYFDSQVIYASETGPKNNRVKRLAIMDQDGANHRFITNGQSLVLTPRFAPNRQTILFMSFENDRPRVYVYDVGSGRKRLVVDQPNMTFAPRFSPDGRYILFSMIVAGNADIYRVAASGGQATRLTTSPWHRYGGSYSPDGSRIVFESDRSGGQQLYVMDADGSNQRRISYGGGRHATPVWSPRGDLIAYTHTGGRFSIGVMAPDGSGAKDLTNGWQDEGPSWAPNGRVLMFFRTAEGSGRADLWSVDLTGVNERRVPTPLDGSIRPGDRCCPESHSRKERRP